MEVLTAGERLARTRLAPAAKGIQRPAGRREPVALAGWWRGGGRAAGREVSPGEGGRVEAAQVG